MIEVQIAEVNSREKRSNHDNSKDYQVCMLQAIKDNSTETYQGSSEQLLIKLMI